MKANIKLIIVSVLSVMVMACATGPIKLPEKYNLDNKLEEVEEIYGFRIDSWQSIDYQSLILKADVNDYYLIILRRPALSLPFSEAIGLTMTVSKLTSGFDNIIVADSYNSESYIIEKIYYIY